MSFDIKDLSKESQGELEKTKIRDPKPKFKTKSNPKPISGRIETE